MAVGKGADQARGRGGQGKVVGGEAAVVLPGAEKLRAGKRVDGAVPTVAPIQVEGRL